MSQGRKISLKTWDRFIAYLSENGTSVKSACNAINITPKSYYNHRVEDADFAKKVDNIMDNIRVPFAEDALFSLINDRNLGAIKFFLSQRGGRRWNDSRVVPIIVQQELRFPPKSEQIAQKLPNKSEQILAAVYEELMDIVDDDDDDNNVYPDKITIDLSGGRIRVLRKE
jgi:hypothetical protein